MTISFTVNGQPQEVEDSRGADRLIEYLHEDLGLTGSKFCCGIGVCRACTVSMTKGPNATAEPIISCSTALSSLHHTSITTIEGVSDGSALHPVQTAFLEGFAFQCGYCTPGFVMASVIFLDWLKDAQIPKDQLDEAIEDAIGAHICRCTGYVKYYEALKATALEVLE
ncbi:MAG: 2Fe-2S iron-sulfur cluster-binding protein [Pseudomonadota bacterium]